MNYKTNKYSKAFTLLELLVAVSVISMMSSVILAAVQNARDKGRISGGIRFATNAYRGFGDKMAAYFDFNDNASPFKDVAGGKMKAMTAQVNTAGTQSFNSSAVVATKQITSYSVFASSSINVVRDTPTGTYGFVRITAGTPSYITLPQSGAVSFWIRVNPDATMDNLMLWDTGANIFMNIPNSASGSNANQVVVNDKGITLASGFAVTDGNWHNITWSSPTSGPEKLYIDGNLVDQEDITGSRITRNFYYFGWNGKFPGAAGAMGFQGDLDDFMMFQQDLAESEVKQIYAMGALSHPVAKANTAK